MAERGATKSGEEFFFFFDRFKVMFLRSEHSGAGGGSFFSLYGQVLFNQGRGPEWEKRGGGVCRLPEIGGGVGGMSVGMVVSGGRRQPICHPASHVSQRRIMCWSNGLWHT